MQGEQKVDAVKWLQFPAMNSYSNLFLPPKHERISPKRNGFRFSPDVVSFTLLNKHIANKFQAIKLEISKGLIAHLPFDNNPSNSKG